MHAPFHAAEGNAALLWPVPRARCFRKQKARPVATPAIVPVEPRVNDTTRPRSRVIRSAGGDALELALFIVTLAATALLHLGALAVIW